MRVRVSFVVAGVLSLTLSASAHHSHGQYAETFQDIEGVVKELHLLTPHSWLYINVKNADGTTEEWKIEGGAPSALLRRGWNRNSLPMGTKIVVNAFRARDGANRASARESLRLMEPFERLPTM